MNETRYGGIGYEIPIGIPCIDELSTGPPGFGVSQVFKLSCLGVEL